MLHHFSVEVTEVFRPVRVRLKETKKLPTPNFVSIQPFSDSLEPEPGAPAPERVISGSPEFRTWNVEEAEGGLYAGIWESSPGKWRIEYDEWEFCHILSGVSVITEEGGGSVTVRAGTAFVLRPGFKGTWEVLETTRKEYVIRL